MLIPFFARFPSARSRGISVAVLIAVALPALAFQAAQQAPVHPVTGRQIAGVMSVEGAAWLVRPERVEEEQPDKALDEIGIEPGMVIADIGAGVGYFTLKMAERTGETGKVYGVDIQPGMLEMLEERAAEAGLTNIETVLSDQGDPKLPANSLDLIFLCDVYHEFRYPQEMARAMHQALKPDGRLVLLEYRGEDPDIPIYPEHKMTVEQVRAELEPEGFVLQEPIETLPIQHILILTKR